MGLAERRAVTAVKENDYKTFEAKVKELCGFEVKMTFDWPTIENHKDCVWICENKRYNGYMFDPIAEALKNVCADNMGKDAVKSALKEINMIPSTGDLTFENGVLTIRNDLTGNGAYGADSIQSTLEKGL